MARTMRNGTLTREPSVQSVTIGPNRLQALLGVPENAKGLVIFAHGSGSGRLSPRNNRVAAELRDAAFATLLLDLLTPEEERDRANVFDISLLASRLLVATEWATGSAETAALSVGYFGASTGAGAAMVAASQSERVSAVVSRGGRPDLAGRALERVRAPTLLIVGGHDREVLELNRLARQGLVTESELIIVPGASHLFEEPGTLDEVIRLAISWFAVHLPTPQRPRP